MPITSSLAHLRISVPLLVALVGGCGSDLSPEQHVGRAEQLRIQGDLSGAVIELKNALQQDPASAPARLLLGQIYLDLGDGAVAEKELNRALELGAKPLDTTALLTRAALLQGKYDEVIAEVLKEPDGPAGLTDAQRAELFALRGDAYLARGKLDVAERQYAAALAIDPRQAHALLSKARASGAQGKLDEARDWLTKALDASPTYGPAWSFRADLDRYEGKTEDAEKAYGEAIANRADNVADYLSRALVRIQLDKLDDAAKDVEVVEARAPRAPGGKYGRGLIAFARSDYSAAAAAFQQALAADQSYMPAVYYLAASQAMIGELEQAEANMARALKAYPGSAQAAKLLAGIRIQKGDYAGAEEAIQGVLAREPNDVEVLELMGDAALGRGKAKEGATWLQKAVAQEARSAKTYVKLGLGMIAAGELEAGLDALAAAAELDTEGYQAEQALFRTYLRSGQYDRALGVAEDLRKENPHSPLPDNLAGLVYLASKQVDKAREAFERSLGLSPGYPPAAHNLARLEQAEGRRDKAREIYEQVLRKQPDHLGTLVALAMLDGREGKIDRAKARLELAVERHPDALQPRVLLSRYYVRSRQPDKALGFTKPIEARYPDNPLLLMEIGMAQLQGGSPGSAAETFGRLTEVAPRFAGGHFYLAQALAELGDSRGARTELDRALAVDPEDLLANMAKIRLLILDGELDSAEAVIARLWKRYPKLADLATREAELAGARKQPEAAVTAYRRALELDPGAGRVVSLARAQRAAGDGAGAVASLQGWLSSHPQDQLVQYMLAEALLSLGDEVKAREAFEKSLELNASNAAAYNNLAWLLRDVDSRKALQHAEKAVQLAPESPEVLDTLGVILTRVGQAERAAEVLRQAATRAPGSPAVQYHLAAALAAAGQPQEAVRVLEPLLADQREFRDRADAQRLLERLTAAR